MPVRSDGFAGRRVLVLARPGGAEGTPRDFLTFLVNDPQCVPAISRAAADYFASSEAIASASSA